MSRPRDAANPETELGWLIYELLDAHADTVELATGSGGGEVRWAAHLDYLRALERAGKELLARSGRLTAEHLGTETTRSTPP